MIQRKRLCVSLLLPIVFCFTERCAAAASRSSLKVTRLEVDARQNPAGIDRPTPDFGWVLAASDPQAHHLVQSSYRIIVASTLANASNHNGDLWDSGLVKGRQTTRIAYGGRSLESHRRYFWNVFIAAGGGDKGEWSPVSHFLTGMLHADDWHAQWIAAQPESEVSAKLKTMPIFRKAFDARKPIAEAVIVVAGLGQYELRLNGRSVTTNVLTPAWSSYRKTILYDTYDVTGQIRQGKNVFGVLLGNGMFNVQPEPGRYSKFDGSFGEPKLLLECHILYQDGTRQTVYSDQSWKHTSGPISFSSTYGGEDFDATREPVGWDRAGYVDTEWTQAVAVSGPGGSLSSTPIDPIRVMRSFPSVSRTEPRAGVQVYDFGQNMAGWPELLVSGKAHTILKLTPGELLDDHGFVTQKSSNQDSGPLRSTIFRYALRGGGAERWHPRFTYWGFRYLQVEVEQGPAPSNLEVVGQFVHADLPLVGTFHTSDKLLGQIHGLIDAAILSNSVSLLTDCPHREKLGWLEQTYLNASSLFYNFDYRNLYRKMQQDISDSQLSSGMVPSIAPEFVRFVDQDGHDTAFRDSPEFGSASILSPWAAYTFSGDRRLLSEAYPSMQRYVAFLQTRASNNIVDYGLGDWFDIGPGEPGFSKLTAKAVTATATYYEDLTTLSKVAEVLNLPADASAYSGRAEQVKAAYNHAFFHADGDFYDRNSQTANAISLASGLVPAGHETGVLEHLIADIRAHSDHITAGDIGFHYLVRALSSAGRADVLFDILRRTDAPSYGYQLSRGATTLTEAWDANPIVSQNHFMLGHAEEWFYRGLAGIMVDMSAADPRRIVIQPQMVAGVNSASASYRSVVGEIQSAWRREPTRLLLDIEIPPNVEATVSLPSVSLPAVTVNGRSAASSGCTLNDSLVTCRVASGSYHLVHTTSAGAR